MESEEGQGGVCLCCWIVRLWEREREGSVCSFASYFLLHSRLDYE